MQFDLLYRNLSDSHQEQVWELAEDLDRNERALESIVIFDKDNEEEFRLVRRDKILIAYRRNDDILLLACCRRDRP